jgi:hypothetical protein
MGNPQPTIQSESPVAEFVRRWHASAAAERANFHSFCNELCDLLAVPRPDPARQDERDNAYVYDKTVWFDDGDGKRTANFIDLYKRACFVMEAKQGSEADNGGPDLFDLTAAVRGKQRRGTAVRGTAQWDAAMKKAKGQALRYVHDLSPAEGNPPFIIVVDVGYTLEIYADFSRLGKTYSQFPDAQTYRIALKDLADEKIRQRLGAIWLDPLSLDPTRHSAKVTREIAAKLAVLARSFEAADHHPEVVAAFLMRCLFTFFAEDVGLIDLQRSGEQPFTELLRDCRGKLDQFIPMVQNVWSTMDRGGFSPAMRRKLRHFNGKLFHECQVLPVNEAQLELLIEAGESDWSDVEPAIFGTLLERALDDRERHKLGAHYTPRAYVERLVLPTVIEPLRERWDAARAAAFTLNMQGKNEDARKAVDDFLVELCNTTVLDPACGSGNFLYVTMEHMKKLEGEVRDELRQLGETQELLERAGRTVDPHQFLGLEINPRAVAIAELVLWIGYLKWHLRTLGHAPAEPLLKAFNNIKEQDAVLAYDRKELVLDEQGKPVTRWDGHTMKVSPVTGEKIPDERAGMPVYRYLNARPAAWPRSNYVVGNPPFIGNKRMREALGDGYVDAIRRAYPGVPGSVDFVMYWWDRAAELAMRGTIRRFGFITTNSLTQTYSSQVLQKWLAAGLSLAFAIPDHPWTDVELGAAVRISMTVAERLGKRGTLAVVISEGIDAGDGAPVELQKGGGEIAANLIIGNNTAAAVPLRSNAGLCWQGCKLVGEHFQISPDKRAEFLRFDDKSAARTPAYIAGSDITKRVNQRFVIDLFGLSEAQARRQFPALIQHIVDYVKPEREQNRDKTFREKWWIFGRPRPELRAANAGLRRYIVTSEVSKHRAFIFQQWPETLVDGSVVAIAAEDAFTFGVLSSRAHVVWALKAGGRLEDRPRYQNGPCYDPFPFPEASKSSAETIRGYGESLDAHRKRQQSAHRGLTITDMYNVLEKLRKGDPLTAKDKVIHEQGLVSVLKQIHDDLDAAVAEAYGWPVRQAQGGPADLSDDEILRRLVDLNAERAEEERRGIIRWLRPEFQNPTGSAQTQGTLALPAATPPGKAKPAKKTPWPKGLAEQARAVRAALQSRAQPASAEELAKAFAGAKAGKIAELLETLATLGQARVAGEGKYAA